jgi:hypothetical protein
MEDIIEPVELMALLAELTEEHFLRNTSKGGNQVYLVNYHSAPNITREVGRLREVAFRAAGGGTGKAIDLDDYDTSAHPYDQLIVWDPEDQEIMAGYRLLTCRLGERDAEGNLISATSKLFKLSSQMLNDFLPRTIELGRSFVQPKYQRTAPRKGLFAMDNLFDGLAAVMTNDPELEYMFGKVTMFPHYEREARNIILSFMRYFFPDPDKLVVPRIPLVKEEELLVHYPLFEGLSYKEAHRVLHNEVKKRGESIPPLINSYMSLSSTMRSFGTAENSSFGTVEETGILVAYNDIEPARTERYIKSYESNKEFRGPLFVSKT